MSINYRIADRLLLFGLTMFSLSFPTRSVAGAEPLESQLKFPAVSSAESPADSTWLLSTRHMTSQVCRADLLQPDFRIAQMDDCGRQRPASLDEYLMGDPSELHVIYVHGNRMSPCETIERALLIRQRTLRYRTMESPRVRWLVWSWPSEQEGILLNDAQLKAARTDAQGLYLAWLLRELIDRGHQPRMIGFSFGARVITGSLNALAGGPLAGRQLPIPHMEGANVCVGLLAPAIGEDWLCGRGYHRHATHNMQKLTVLYSRRDAVLRRYRFLDPGSQALGYRGPRGFGVRYDGSPLPVIERNCSPTVGRRHSEEDYYVGNCNAGLAMFRVVSNAE